jgi:mRNA-degrading endonuclease toxin of MazEF toxin-antitoxin module
VSLGRGSVVLVGLDPTVGHEQRGMRPCIAVSDPAVNADQRFPLIAIIPITGTPGEGARHHRSGARAVPGSRVGHDAE